jgi:hypothetical protein
MAAPTRSTKRRFSLLPDDGWVCLSLAVIIAALFLVGGLDRAGIWDPYELDRAEHARRIAIHVFGAEELSIAGAPNGMPTLSDLGAGELGFTSMAAGFAAWGLHPFAGRLPLALWALAGAIALYGFIARIAGARAGLYSAVALVTMPAYFLQARTMLGDAVAMAAFAMCLAGLGGALLEERGGRAVAFGALGVAGAAAGFMARGLLIGVAAPCLGVGLGWLALAGDARHRRARPLVVGIASLTTAALAILGGALPLYRHGTSPFDLARVVGAAVRPPVVEATFDLVVRDLGHALFPWSAVLPLAFALLMRRREAPARDVEQSPRDALATLLLVAAAAAYGVHATLSLFTGPLPFAGVAVLAAVAGLAAAEIDRAPAMPLAAVATLVLGYVLLHDLLEIPEKVLVAFGVSDPDMPVGAGESLAGTLRAAALSFGVLAALAWFAGPAPETGLLDRLQERRRAYEAAFATLGRLWRGNLAFGFLLVEAMLVGLGATLLIGRRAGWPSVMSMPYGVTRIGLNLWWLLPLVLLLVPLALDAARYGYEHLFRALGLPRSAGLLVAAGVAGAILCFGYYPALAAQLSPREALDAFARQHRPGEALGLLGVSGRMGRYYARGDDTTSLSGPSVAAEWLAGAPADAPRWLAFREGQLAEVNSRYRAEARRNLGVVDTGGGQILLAVSDLGGRASVNPLEGLVNDAPPAAIAHPVTARFGDALEALGWEIVDENGAPVAELVPGVVYLFRAHYHVLARIGRAYRAFVHVDAAGAHHTIDHDVLAGRYPMPWWQPDDYIVDEHAFALPQSFLPGRYAVFFGFYVKDEDRLPVSEGRHQNNRVVGGTVIVR